MKIALMMVTLGSVGCLQSNINGATNGSPSSAGAPAASTAGSGAGSTAAASATGGSSAAASSTGGTTAGSVAGSSTGGSSSGAGTTGGTTTGDAGPCIAFETTDCASNDACCSGACVELCRQPTGQPCLTDSDCASGNCPDSVCVCATPGQDQNSYCSSDADCCNGLSCQLSVFGGEQYGQCCNPVGGSCQGDADCCDNSCVNGTCACLPVDSEGCSEGECCLGQCVSNANGGGVSACLNAPGDPCNGSYACITSNCQNGTCGSCSAETGGLCTTTADCCTGAICAAAVVDIGNDPFSGMSVDGGSTCCAGAGASCDAGENVDPCCSGACANGLCTCAKPTDQCYNTESCCAGGACMIRTSSGSGSLACCQVDGQFCLASDECCSGLCSGQSCACVADGGSCGGEGSLAAAGPAACCSGACNDAGACE